MSRGYKIRSSRHRLSLQSANVVILFETAKDWGEILCKSLCLRRHMNVLCLRRYMNVHE